MGRPIVATLFFFAPAFVAAQSGIPSPDSLPPVRAGQAKTISAEELSDEARTYFSVTPEPGAAFRSAETSPQSVRMLDRFVQRAQAKPLDRRALSTSLSKLPDELTSSILLGELGETGMGSTVTRVSRLFKMGGKTVMLTEWDYPADGGGIVQVSEAVNTDVRGAPGVLIAKRAGEEVLWNLVWASSRKDYSLYLHESVFDAGTAALIHKIATGISE